MVGCGRVWRRSDIEGEAGLMGAARTFCGAVVGLGRKGGLVGCCHRSFGECERGDCSAMRLHCGTEG